ncbi:potassium channel subfamily K member 6 [Denticeps clupeoides]|uniref:Potassium channel subfamily K member n=1 Tax=Denticeps clupeoides TaxID=299321 RepID=A0AAY4E9B1_9TELE|nr:potassium channel subfamily K member 6 [Denticeps clupeoides]
MSSAGRSWLFLAGFVLFYAAYLVLGALVFSAIERPEEERLRLDLASLRERFLNQSCVDGAALDLFLEKVLKANKYGVSALHNASGAANWDLAAALFFASTLVTTVGYGHTTPLSDEGKAFSIVYALLGVPFTMLVLTACVQRLMYLVTYRPVNLFQQRGALAPRVASVIHFTILMVLVVVCFFIVPALVFSRIEEPWSFLDALYFCFISLCTIGLGDFVPGEQPHQKLRALYKVSIIVYLFVGLMFMYLVLRTFHKLADLHGFTAFFHLPACEEDEQQDRVPIVEEGREEGPPEADKTATKPLDVASQTSYNTINR